MNIENLEFKPHQINLIIGESGSGKTTLFNLITGALPHKGWSFLVDKVDLNQLPISQRRLGVVFQSYDLFPHMTALENIDIVMRAKKSIKSANIDKLNHFKKLLKLDKCWLTKAQDLSGGEKQRVALLRALISEPRLLLLDEPFSALDNENKTEARELVKQVIVETGLTTLMITHDLNDQALFSQNIFCLKKGRLELKKELVEQS